METRLVISLTDMGMICLKIRWTRFYRLAHSDCQLQLTFTLRIGVRTFYILTSRGDKLLVWHRSGYQSTKVSLQHWMSSIGNVPTNGRRRISFPKLWSMQLLSSPTLLEIGSLDHRGYYYECHLPACFVVAFRCISMGLFRWYVVSVHVWAYHGHNFN